MKVLDGYFGGKGAEGVYQRLINNIPEHECFWSGFAGNCAIARNKLPAKSNVITDLDWEVVCAWNDAVKERPENWSALRKSAIDILETWNSYTWITPKTYCYFDPPYMDDVRTSKSGYKYDMRDRCAHEHFIQLASSIPAMVAISHYPCDLYNEYLADWRCIEYLAATRGGPRKECLWMNYKEPNRLHDYRYLGEDFRQREKFKRRANTLIRKLERMESHERKAALGRIIKTFEI